MTYQQFLDYIFQRYSGNVKLGLERMEGVLAEMGSPQQKLRGIHIGGTNGKGSTSAACEALALAHDLHTGLNTSPHLIDYCERFRIDGADVDFKYILRQFHRFEQIFSKWDASFFEITTALAFQIFKQNKIHTSIFEVGLGGRLDATNLFQPDVCGITTIGLDHMKTLGRTLEKIAFEKAGILKPKVPVVLGGITGAPLKVILKRAMEVQAPPVIFDRDYFVSNIRNEADGVCLDYRFGSFELKNLKTNLIGRHQALNAAMSLTLWLLYAQIRDIAVEKRKIRMALKHVNWKGRMQCLGQNPYILVDGAHNLQGITVLAKNLKELFSAKKLLFVVSILADKNYPRMLEKLAPLAKCFYISKNESDRAAEIAEQAEVVMKTGVQYQTLPTVTEAFRQALADSSPEDAVIGCGSLYTVAEIMRSIEGNQ